MTLKRNVMRVQLHFIRDWHYVEVNLTQLQCLELSLHLRWWYLSEPFMSADDHVA